jgi:hypothetical protein
MNKTTKILIIIVAVLAAVYFIFVARPWSTLKPELKDFAISDTGAITKFFLADKRGNSVTIARNAEGVWMVNDLYEADKTKVNLLLATMHDVTVRNPIAESAFNTVVADLATEGVKAEFYEGGKRIKTVYVGSSTPDQTGTFMMIDGSSTPFVTHIQGFVGYLSPRFFPFAMKWKGRKVFDTPLEKVAGVKITYPAQPGNSFELKNTPVTLLNGEGKTIRVGDEKFARFYLSGFQNLYFEGYDESLSGAKADSIKQLTPFCVIELSRTDGVKTRLQVHYKRVDDHTKSQYDREGMQQQSDIEKYYAFINDEKEVVYIQQYTFGRLFKTLNDFTVSH